MQFLWVEGPLLSGVSFDFLFFSFGGGKLIIREGLNKMEDIHGGEAARMMMQQQQQVHYLQEEHHGLHHMSNGIVGGHNNLMNHHDEDNGGGAVVVGIGSEVMDADAPTDPPHLSDHHGASLPVSANDNLCSNNSNQLTLSFQGQVYVFDSVSPEKVPT